MKLLVTGGAGFIGSALVDRLLAEGHDVEALDDLSTGSLANLADARADRNGRLRFHQVDVRDPHVVDLIARRAPEVIFHLAAQVDVRVSVARPVFDAEVNVLGTLNVLEGARRAGTRKVVAASSGGTIYGEVAPRQLPAKESLPLAPVSPYGVSKRVALDYLRVYRRLHDVEHTALALGNVYGPRQDPGGEAGVVAIFAEKLLRGETPTINGHGLQTRDYVFVGDVVEANLRALERDCPGPVNIGTGRETDVNTLAAALIRLAGAGVEPAHGPAKPGEQRRSVLDASLAGRLLGWQPKVSLEEGLRRTFEWFREKAR